MPHAVFVTSYPFPGVGATANRVRALAEAVAHQRSWEVTVVGPGPDEASTGHDEGVLPYRVVACPGPAYSRSNLVQRAMREATQAWRLLAEARRRSADVVVVTAPSVFLLAGVFVVARGGAVADLRDLVWEYLLSRAGALRVAGLVARTFAMISLRRAAAVTVTNDQEARLLRETGAINPVVIRNGISEERLNALAPMASASPRRGQSALSVLYVGNVGLAQGLDTLVRAVADSPNVRVTIIGSGADFDRLLELVEHIGADNVSMLGPLTWEHLPEHYEAADVLYAQIGSAYKSAVPSKLFEYLATGRTVVFGAPRGSATDVLEKFEGVNVVPPDDVESLRRVLLKIADSPPAGTFINNAHLVRDEHLREAQASRFAEIVNDTYKNKRPGS